MGLQVIKKQLWSAQALSNTTVSTDWIDTSQIQAGSFSFVWSGGSSPVGVVEVRVSNEANKSDESTLTLSSVLNVSGASGAHVANLNIIPTRFVRLRYVGTSGTATANAWFFGKGDAN